MGYFDGYLITGSSDSTVKVWIVDPKDGAGMLIVSLSQPLFAEQITRQGPREADNIIGREVPTCCADNAPSAIQRFVSDFNALYTN